LRKELEPIYGKINFSVVEYELIKIIIIPLNEYEIMFITTSKEENHIPLTKWIKKNLNEFRQGNIYGNYSEVSLSSERYDFDIPINHAMLRDYLEDIDEVDEIVIHRKGEETQGDYIVKDVWKRWKYRLKFKNKIGEPLYAMTFHDKKVTAACLIDNNESLVLLKLNPSTEQEALCSLMLSIKHKHTSGRS
jgi:hypothetical protein